jgi:ATPase subunit of ABC transporter with duplicated ATPase domains
MELNPKAITFDVHPVTQETQELCRSGRTHHTSLTYQLLVEADDNELLILDEPTNDIEAISNIDSNKWLEVMIFEMDSMYIN